MLLLSLLPALSKAFQGECDDCKHEDAHDYSPLNYDAYHAEDSFEVQGGVSIGPTYGYVNVGEGDAGDTPSATTPKSFIDRVRYLFFPPQEDGTVQEEDKGPREDDDKIESNSEWQRSQTLTTDLADWFDYTKRAQFLFQSEMTEPMNGRSHAVDHINPVEVQGSEDIMGAEEKIYPFMDEGLSYHGRTFANTIHRNMVMPNPIDYPTPEANNPWAPWVNAQTYDQLKDTPFPPYPSAMQWATNPDNYEWV